MGSCASTKRCNRNASVILRGYPDQAGAGAAAIAGGGFDEAEEEAGLIAFGEMETVLRFAFPADHFAAAVEEHSDDGDAEGGPERLAILLIEEGIGGAMEGEDGAVSLYARAGGFHQLAVSSRKSRTACLGARGRRGLQGRVEGVPESSRKNSHEV